MSSDQLRSIWSIPNIPLLCSSPIDKAMNNITNNLLLFRIYKLIKKLEIRVFFPRKYELKGLFWRQSFSRRPFQIMLNSLTAECWRFSKVLPTLRNVIEKVRSCWHAMYRYSGSGIALHTWGCFLQLHHSCPSFMPKLWSTLKSGGWLRRVLTFEMWNPAKFFETLKWNSFRGVYGDRGRFGAKDLVLPG